MEVIREGIDWYEGTKLANACYKYLHLHSCAVVEVIADSERIINEETGEVTFEVSKRMLVVYKITTLCPHNHIQEVFHFSRGQSIPYCEDCKCNVPTPPKVIDIDAMITFNNIKLNTLVGDAIIATSSLKNTAWGRGAK